MKRTSILVISGVVAGCVGTPVTPVRQYEGPPFQGGQAKTVTVQAQAMWQDTGIVVGINDKLFFDTSGKWSIGLNAYASAAGRVGIWPNAGPPIITDAPFGALIGKTGSSPAFHIGAQGYVRAGAPGALTLAMNDTPGWFGDNAGSISVTIWHRKAQDGLYEPVVQRKPEGETRQSAVAPAGNRWAVVIGVSEYEFTGEGGLDDLVFAKKDAEDFARSLEQLGWDRDHIKLVVNEQATKRNVNRLLESWLRIAEPEDMIVLFWSSHGWPDPEDPEKAYFACHDSIPSDPSSGYRMDQVRRLLAERRTRNVVLIADTCHAGKVIRGGAPRDVSIGPALESMKERQEIPKGWVFIASAEPDRKAYEDLAWSNGALTHVLLEGLRDANADGYKSTGAVDGIVTLGELKEYIRDRMATESVKILGARLDPLFYTTSGDPGIWELSFADSGKSPQD